jgi:hypothetical protein
MECAFRFESGYYNNSNYNSFIGYQLVKIYTTGNYNTFIGYQAEGFCASLAQIIIMLVWGIKPVLALLLNK